MNKSYISIWSEVLGTWVAASENTSARGKRSKSRVVVEAVVAMSALSGLWGASAAQANTTGSGLQLCNAAAGATSGMSWGPGTTAATALSCATGTYSFSLNNSGTDAGGNGFSTSTARVTGYINGTLELMGANGISMLNVVQMNSNKITGLAAGAVNATSTDAINGSQLASLSTSTSTSIGSLSTGLSSLSTGVGSLSSSLNATNQNVSSINNAGTRYFKASGLANGTDDANAIGQAIAIGASSLANASSSMAIGSAASATAGSAVALGWAATSSANGSVALGPQSTASANNAVALGWNANATAVNSVALGKGSTTKADLSAAGYNPGSATLSGTASAANGEVSVGSSGNERRVTNVAAGSAATDAVNVSQLQSAAAVVTSLSTSTAMGLSSLSTGIGSLSTGLSTTNSNVTSLSTSTATGLSSLSTGVGSLSTGLSTTNSKVASLSTSASTGLTTLSTGLDTTNSNVALLSSKVSTGLSSLSTELDATNNSVASLSTSTATGLSSLSTEVGSLSNSLNTTNNTVGSLSTSISSLSNGFANSVQYDNAEHTSMTLGGANAAVPVTLKNVAAGVDDTDAVNVSQLKDAGLIGGNGQVASVVTYDDASKSVLTMGGANGTKITNVTAGDLSPTSTDAVNGSQLNTTNQNVTKLGSRVADLGDQIANGTAGLVQQDPSTRVITMGKDTDGTSVNMAGTAGNRTVTGVAAGAINAASVALSTAASSTQLPPAQRQVSVAARPSTPTARSASRAIA